ncbi:hypothetical protein [Rheinheimera tilapiae]|uniref:DUF3106 domain-containing protein n=1 Tax=Rheinheimera tilapiae TaxID=875043 RepID=A0ABV6BA89_9GAMM
MTNKIAQLPPEQRQAIELDKRRWLEANQLTNTKRPDEIRTWLMKQMDDEYREDMRRRLNIIRRNRMEIKNNEASTSHNKRAG